MPSPSRRLPEIPERWNVVFDYDAKEDDELTIKAGQVVVVVAKHPDGWWEGCIEANASSVSGMAQRHTRSTTGMFPFNYVRPIGSVPTYFSETNENEQHGGYSKGQSNEGRDDGGGGGTEESASLDNDNVLLDEDLQGMLRGSINHLTKQAKAIESTSASSTSASAGNNGVDQRMDREPSVVETIPQSSEQGEEPLSGENLAAAVTRAAGQVVEMSSKIEEEVIRDNQLSNDMTEAATTALIQVETVLQAIRSLPPSISVCAPPPALDDDTTKSPKYEVQSPETALALRLYAGIASGAIDGPLGYRSIPWEEFCKTVVDVAASAVDALVVAASMTEGARG